MNEKTETPETLAAILAEMRDDRIIRLDGADVTRCLLHNLADRIEAAAEREYAEAKDYFAKLHDGPSMICTAKNCAVRNIGLSLAAAPRKFDEPAPGNAAALREAIVNVASFAANAIDYDGPERDVDAYRWLGRIAHTAIAALAAPARNVDRFATEDEAREAYWAYREPLEFNDKPFVAITEWLFAPAEGGAE